MNRPIRRVGIIAALMFFALLANASWLELGRASSLNDDMRNRRVVDAEYSRNRGAILVGTEAMAISKPNEGEFKYRRAYPRPELYAHLTGHYSYIFGRSGIELNYNKQLAGTSDEQFLSRAIDALTGKEPIGASAQTTINPKAQQAAWEAMEGRKGSVVALNHKTGEVLAYLSLPSYDPNSLSSTTLSSTQKAWQKLVADKDKPLLNRASKEIYPPGSTFKLVTAAAALENGVTSEDTFPAPERLRLPQTQSQLTNQVNCGGDRVTLEQALKTSCNTAFARIGMDVGADKLRTQAEKFGFNEDFETDVPLVASRFPKELNKPQTAQSAIGQYDVAATPLQMAMVAAGIANDGVVMQPHLVKEVRGADLQVISTHRPTPYKKAMSAKNAELLQEMMVATVNDGTGTAARIDGLRVGGKTGTAQSDPERPPYAWFVAFSDDPDVAVAVFIEDAGIDRSDIAGGRLAGPVAKAVIEALR